MQIKTKQEFSALSNRGRLGNFLQSWPTYEEYVRSGYTGFTTIRSRTAASPYFRAVVAPGAVAGALADLLADGASLGDLYIQQIPDPDSRRRMQLEAMPGHLFYEFDTVEPLRGIRERGTYVTGAVAARILRDYLYEDSFETICELWYQYPTAIIEATEFSLPCGAFNKNLVIWETRCY